MRFNKITFILSLLSCLPLVCFAIEHKVNITTYYPAPYGAYNELQTNKLRVGESTGDDLDQGVVQFESLTANPTAGEGSIYYNSSSRQFRYRDNSSWKGFGGTLYYKRSVAHKKDKIIWCPSTHPNVISCMAIDDEAPQFSVAEGVLDSNGKAIRGGLGADFIYTERVKDSLAGVYGCMSYDDGHNHSTYRLEAVCTDMSGGGVM